MRRGYLVAAVFAVAGLAVGCTGESNPVESVETGRIAPGDLATIPALEGAVGAREDVTFGDCSTDPGEVTVTASLTNSADAARDYVIVVSWTTDTSDVLARGVATVDEVAPGDSADVTVSAQVPDGAATCTFNVQAAAADGQ